MGDQASCLLVATSHPDVIVLTYYYSAVAYNFNHGLTTMVQGTSCNNKSNAINAHDLSS
jgi:hypothetical protein